VASVATRSTFDLTKPLQLSDDVSLRDEEFGALAYHHVNRRLVFLKSRPLVDLVRQLHNYPSARDAIESLVEPDEHDRYEAALASLYRSELLRG
jgi:putative mycofactocin binding protein MftB